MASFVIPCNQPWPLHSMDFVFQITKPFFKRKMNIIRSDIHNAVDFLIIGYCSKDRESAFRMDDMILL